MSQFQIAQTTTPNQIPTRPVREYFTDPAFFVGLTSGIVIILVGQWINHLFTKKRDFDKESKEVWRQKMENEKTSQVLEFQATLNQIASNMVTKKEFSGLETKVDGLETKVDRGFTKIDRKFDLLTRGMPENEEMKRIDAEFEAEEN